MATQYKHLGFITAAITAILIVSNISAVKLVDIGVFVFDGGTFLFPIAYIFGDILTEVYGYRQSRRVIWTAFFWLAVSTLTFQIVILAPAASDDFIGDAFSAVLAATPRIIMASLIAYVCGEFINSYVLAKMKVATSGKWLFTRTIGSTVAAQFADTALFMFIAFWGVFDNQTWLNIVVSGALFKIAIEILMTPVTYAVVKWLKQSEQSDVYDYNTCFSPFAFSTDKTG